MEQLIASIKPILMCIGVLVMVLLFSTTDRKGNVREGNNISVIAMIVCALVVLVAIAVYVPECIEVLRRE